MSIDLEGFVRRTQAALAKHGIQTLRPIRAQVGEVVEIIWRDHEGQTLHERHSAPPEEVWNVRIRAVTEELRRHAMKERYERIAQDTIVAAEKTGGSMLDFVLGLKDISDTVRERMELSLEELSPEERESYDND